jgi:spermidine/putrescine transport system permease protein
MKIFNYFINAAILILFYLFLYTPIISIIIGSLFDSSGWTFKWYHALFKRTDIFISLGNSLLTSFASVSLSIIISLFGIAYLFLNGNSSKIVYIFILNTIIPEIVFAIALLLFFVITKITLGRSTLIIAHTVISLGYTFPLLYQRWKEIDGSMIRAAYDLGARPFVVWNTIVIPFLMPVLVAASCLTFIISFDDYLLSYFCGSSSVTTISIPILSMLRTGISPEMMALSTLLMAISFIVGLIYIIYVGFENYEKK